MKEKKNGKGSSDYWDRYSESNHYFNDIIQEHKAKCYSDVIKKSLLPLIDEYEKERKKNGQKEPLKILITDLYDESFGLGFITDILGKRGFDFEIIGIDISRKIVKKSNDRNSDKTKTNYHVADVTRLPFKNASFDIIISPSTLDQLKREEIKLALEELRACLKPKGLLFLTLLNKKNLYVRSFSLIKRILRIQYDQEFYSSEEIYSLMKSTGYMVKFSDNILTIPPLLNQLSKLSFNSKICNLIKDTLKSERRKIVRKRNAHLNVFIVSG